VFNINFDELEKSDLLIRCWESQKHFQNSVCKCCVIHKSGNLQLSPEKSSSLAKFLLCISGMILV
jgi:hypothetical protein